MTEVISVKFKNRGKCYYFSPAGLDVKSGELVVVETSKGLELADCFRGNHMVPDEAVVQPLRPLVRIATADDRRVAELNKQREKDAFEICQKKIAEHGLDMKLVDVECSFEGNKTMFFFTSDGRVDFRELVKDLAGIFRNRIELRQIGVRDEAKMIGGIGICGRPYCCSQFLDDFQPVSTKMAKVQSLSLNPTKISGSCGRLMCCLRYEQEAYEEHIKKVPKQGAFVETKDGYGTAVQVNLLRQTVHVRLDKDTDDSIHTFKPNELAAVPGGRPKDGEAPVSVLRYVPEPEETDDEPEATVRPFAETPTVEAPAAAAFTGERSGRNGRRRTKQKRPAEAAQPAEARSERRGADSQEQKRRGSRGKSGGKTVKVEAKAKTPGEKPAAETAAKKPTPPAEAQRKSGGRRHYYRGKGKPKGPGEGGNG